MKRDKIIQIISHPVEMGLDEEDNEIFKNYIWGLTEEGVLYEWNAILKEWDFVTLSPEVE